MSSALPRRSAAERRGSWRCLLRVRVKAGLRFGVRARVRVRVRCRLRRRLRLRIRVRSLVGVPEWNTLGRPSVSWPFPCTFR